MIFREHPAKDRYVAVVIAQIGGLAILVINYFVFSVGPAVEPPPDIRLVINAGVATIFWATIIYFLLSALIAGYPFIRAVRLRAKDALNSHNAVDVTVISFVTLDIAILLFLVCQEGGLCRGVFIPVFFLIPLAYLSVERPSKLWRALVVLLTVVGCILISFVVSRLGWPPHQEGNMLLLPIPITDFHRWDHPHHDWAILWVSLISSCIPVFEIGTILYRTRNVEEVVGVHR
jgi:hypothetical protein